ncbi:MAG: hypothetical protein JSS55_03865 [Proteobacteria bacterium]|nr:hypothetical protein [Pseudomonadota bacterium]
MSDNLDHSDLKHFAEQFFDLSVNPLAEILTKLLDLLVQKDVVTRQEALHLVASSIGVISELPYSEPTKESAADVLVRMLRALDVNGELRGSLPA